MNYPEANPAAVVGYVTPMEGEESPPVDADVSQQTEQSEKTSRRKGVPLPKRISQMTYQNKLLQEQFQHAQEQLQHVEYLRQQERAELEREKNIYKEMLAKKEQDEIQTLEQTISTNEKVILNEMRRAKEAQDIDEEMRWQGELGDLHKAHAQIQAHKVAKQNMPQVAHDEYVDIPLQPAYQPQPIQPNYNPHYLDWVESTPWANPNDPNYSAPLVNEVDKVAEHVNTQLKLNGRADVIGTPEYFSTLNNIIYERYQMPTDDGQQDDGRHGEGSIPTAPQSYYTNSHVGGVSRQGATMADQYIQNNSFPRGHSRVTLTPEQEAIASNLQIRGMDGNYLTPAETRQRYIKHLNAPVAEGGSKYKLVFDQGL